MFQAHLPINKANVVRNNEKINLTVSRCQIHLSVILAFTYKYRKGEKVTGHLEKKIIFVAYLEFVMFVRVLFVIIFFNICLVDIFGTNYALIVAIDKYPETSGWNRIHATNDIEIIFPLLKGNGFSENNITLLTNELATKKSIVESLDNICTKVKTGDYVYLHFSCHGQQMIDDNGDEPDGLDEALIPYDAQRRYSKKIYEGENHLRDDELGILADRIRKKVGADGYITIVIDACHSGTANREDDEHYYKRGTTYVFAPEGYNFPKIRQENKKILKLKNSKRLAPFSVFSACQPDQINYEYFDIQSKTYYGALSYAIFKVSESYKNRYVSVMEFHNQIEKQIALMFANRKKKQMPYLETTDENKTFRIGH